MNTLDQFYTNEDDTKDCYDYLTKPERFGNEDNQVFERWMLIKLSNKSYAKICLK